MKTEPLKRHTFIFNPQDNSGEQLSLTTEYFDNGDSRQGLPSGIFTNQQITLQSYCNSMTIELCGASISPEQLRNLANQMEQCYKEASVKAIMKHHKCYYCFSIRKCSWTTYPHMSRPVWTCEYCKQRIERDLE